MLQTTYLTVDELKDFTPISANVDVTLLENWIPVAESMHIVPILGTALDTALKAELEATGTLTGDNYTLLTHIQNASAWYTFLESVTFIRTKAVNKGVTQGYSDNSNTTPLDDFKDFKQSILDKAIFFRNYLIDFLTLNASTYPLWRSDDDECGESYNKDFSGGIWV